MATSSKKNSGAKKVKHAFYDFISKEPIQQEIHRLREKYSIPAQGFPATATELEKANFLYTPTKWKFHGDHKVKGELTVELQTIMRQFPQGGNVLWPHFFRLQLFHDKVPEFALENLLEHQNVCMIAKNTTNWTDTMLKDPNSFFLALDIEQQENLIYPISIKITPDASQRNITDFIRLHWWKIEWLLNEAKGNEAAFGKTRSRPNRKLYDFLIKNQNKSTRELTSMVNSKFKRSMNEDSVRSLLSKARGERKKV